MLETLQKALPWIWQLSTPAKGAFTVLIVGTAIFCLMLMWAPPPKPPAQQTGTGPGPVPPKRVLWPEDPTLQGLTERLDRLSRTDRSLMKFVVNAGRDGVYVNELATSLGISRAEALSRANQLATYELIEVLDLTDKNFRLSHRLKDFLAATNPNILPPLLE